jgi:parallel beta-helix repeat protein/putative cofactor-binding repeat protein
MLRRDVYVGFVAAAGSTLLKAAQAQTCSPPCHAQTPAEAAAGITPSDYSHQPGNVLRYGANTSPGTTDMTAAIQAAINQAAHPGGAPAYVSAGTYHVASTPLNLSSNVRLHGDGSSSIIEFGSTANQDCIAGISVSNVSVSRLKLVLLSPQFGCGYVGTVAFRKNSTNCAVEDCEITGATSVGVLLSGSSNCRIARNYFHSFLDRRPTVDATVTAGRASIAAAQSLCALEPVMFPAGTDFGGVSGFKAATLYHVSKTGLSRSAFLLSPSNSGIPVITPGGSGTATASLTGVGGADSADIRLMTEVSTADSYDCSYNVIEHNQCFGGNNHGIALETSSVPDNLMTKNIVTGNRVGAHTAYGILAYSHQAGDTYNEIASNYIENISGTSISQGGSAGAGIYVAGMGAVSVVGNTIRNCCTATSNTSLAPGGIGVDVATGSPITIAGNSIHDMAQGNAHGLNIAHIYIVGSPAGTTITGNTCSQRVAGGIGSGIYLSCSTSAQAIGVTLTGNNVNILNTIANCRGIYAYASAFDVQNLTISGNVVLGCSYRGIALEQAKGYAVRMFTVNGNTVSAGASTCVPIHISGGAHGAVAGNVCNALGAEAMILSACRNVRISGNCVTSTGTVIFRTAGACPGSSFDESNSISSIAGAIDNSGTGCNVRYTAAAIPSGGSNTAQKGDVAYNLTATSSFAWACTTGGTPGTWTAVTLP